MSGHEELRVAVATGDFTKTARPEQELTGEVSLASLPQLMRHYKPDIDALCKNHGTTMITAIWYALDNKTPIETIHSCLDAKLVEFAGCVACQSGRR